MPSNYGISESGVSNRVHGDNHADAYLDMPQSVRTARYGAVDDNDQHLRKKRNQPNEHQFASVSSQSTQSEQCSESDCDGSHHARTDCLCTSANANSTGCICTSSGSASGNRVEGVRTPEPNEHGNFRCPDSGKLCSTNVCQGWCKGDS